MKYNIYKSVMNSTEEHLLELRRGCINLYEFMLFECFSVPLYLNESLKNKNFNAIDHVLNSLSDVVRTSDIEILKEFLIDDITQSDESYIEVMESPELSRNSYIVLMNILINKMIREELINVKEELCHL